MLYHVKKLILVRSDCLPSARIKHTGGMLYTLSSLLGASFLYDKLVQFELLRSPLEDTLLHRILIIQINRGTLINPQYPPE